MSSTRQLDEQRDDGQRFDVIVVGAGFAGMYLLHRLREMGLTARVYEAGYGVGGTWSIDEPVQLLGGEGTTQGCQP